MEQMAILKSIEANGGTFQIVSADKSKGYVADCWFDGDFKKEDIGKVFWVTLRRGDE